MAYSRSHLSLRSPRPPFAQLLTRRRRRRRAHPARPNSCGGGKAACGAGCTCGPSCACGDGKASGGKPCCQGSKK
ncbi:unnamed protein product [Plutella xylostella]|uniref:(diamondback moth) hypothetical protein n=1 Tax=Plutella xylostella TaxID=51655 RepID=A0A8S4FT64_PLUXY|nr:unnamed protein product [Plutella xylostella]